MFRVEVHVDPPLTEISRAKHDLVAITAESSSKDALEWFLNSISDRAACIYPIEQVKTDE